MTLDFDIYDDMRGVKNAVLRIETEKNSYGIALQVLLNGVALREYTDTGELFRPLSIEGLPENEQVRYFEVPCSILRETENCLTAASCGTRLPHNIVYRGAELALYRG